MLNTFLTDKTQISEILALQILLCVGLIFIGSLASVQSKHCSLATYSFCNQGAITIIARLHRHKGRRFLETLYMYLLSYIGTIACLHGSTVNAAGVQTPLWSTRGMYWQNTNIRYLLPKLSTVQLAIDPQDLRDSFCFECVLFGLGDVH